MRQIGYTGKIRIFLENGKVKIGDKPIFRFSNSKPKNINIDQADLNELKDVLCEYMKQEDLKELNCNLKSIVGIGGESIILKDPKRKNSVKKFIPLQNFIKTKDLRCYHNIFVLYNVGHVYIYQVTIMG